MKAREGERKKERERGEREKRNGPYAHSINGELVTKAVKSWAPTGRRRECLSRCSSSSTDAYLRRGRGCDGVEDAIGPPASLNTPANPPFHSSF